MSVSSPEGKLTHEQLDWWCPVVLVDRKEEEKMYRKCPKGLLGVELKEVDRYQFFEQEIVQWDNLHYYGETFPESGLRILEFSL